MKNFTATKLFIIAISYATSYKNIVVCYFRIMMKLQYSVLPFGFFVLLCFFIYGCSLVCKVQPFLIESFITMVR